MINENAPPLLHVTDLKTHFFTEDGVVTAVDGVEFHLNRGEILGLVGESGSGKSVTALSIMRLIGVPGRIVHGDVLFEGRSLLQLSDAEIRDVRGNHISMIFQQPQSSLNPVYTVGDQLAETFHIHMDINKKEAWARSVELMHRVGIPDPEVKAHAYPHEMSGGQAQRVMIAMALALQPKILIADEPTTALDVTIQAQVLNLIADIKEKLKMSVIIITHNLGVVSEYTDRTVVMYAGQIVESGFTRDVILNPRHPYSQGLLKSIPRLSELDKEIHPIPGQVSDLLNLPAQCRFFSRCSQRSEECKQDIPIRKLGDHCEVRCLKVVE